MKSASYVYFVSTDSVCKIGKADDPRKRLRELQVGNHAQLFLQRTIQTNNAKESEKLEMLFHEALKNSLIRGEWYAKKDVEDLLKIIEIKRNDIGTVYSFMSDCYSVMEILEEVLKS